jgi:uncharacterized protein YdaU (DUF1376 family)
MLCGACKKTQKQDARIDCESKRTGGATMKMIWYSFYPADYARDTAHLTMVEHGAYRLLLDHCYMTGNPLPANEMHLHRICRAFAAEEQNALHAVLHQFFTLTDEGWIHERVQSELAKSGEISEKRRQAANLRHKNAERNNANADANADANAQQMNIQSQSQSQSQSQKQTNKEKIKDKQQAARATRSNFSKPSDVDEKVWNDWLQHRKLKKAVVTETVLKTIQREASQAGITLQDALETMCARGWVGFKAEWMRSNNGKPAQNLEAFDGFLGVDNVIEFNDETGEWK